MTEKEVRDIVKSVLKSEMANVPNTAEVKKIAKEEAKNFMTEKEVKEMIKKTMLSYHKWMWEKKGMWMSQI
jgi:plasmid stability protein